MGHNRYKQTLLSEWMNSNHLGNLQSNLDWIIKPFSGNHLFSSSKRSPNQILPFKDEALSSWFVRFAHANLTSGRRFIKDLNLDINDFDIDLKYNIDILNFINQKSSISIQLLQDMGYFRLKDEINDFFQNKVNSMRKFEELWFTSWFYRNGDALRFCPICLQEDEIPYFRKVWRLRFLPFCIKHRCFLIRHCSECNSPVSYYRLKWDKSLNICVKCGNDLANSKPIFIPKVDSYIDDIYSLYQNQNLDRISQILLLVWFLAQYSNIRDQIYSHHFLAHEPSCIKFWDKYSKKGNSVSRLKNLQILYLLIGTAIQFCPPYDYLEEFFLHYILNSKLWSNPGVFSCVNDKCDFFTNNFSVFLSHRCKYN